MPDDEDPRFCVWSAALKREIARLDEGAFPVGHSIGGTILLHALAKQPQLLWHVPAVCLVAAPFVGEGGWPSDEIRADRDRAAPLAGVAVYLPGDADERMPMTHLELKKRRSRRRISAASAAAIIN